MLEFFRSHQKLMQFLLLLLILPSFVLFGLEGYSRFRDGDVVLAVVGDQKIKQGEFDAVKKQQLERMRQVLGASFDPKLLEGSQADQAILDGLINDKLVDWAVRENRLTASDARLREVISTIPAVQDNGQFNLERYRTLLGAQGMTPEMFEARLRQDIAKGQVTNPLALSEFIPKSVADRLSQINESVRTVSLLTLKPEAYAAAVNVTPEQIDAFYKANQALYKSPEQGDIEFVVLQGDVLASQLPVSEADAKGFYDQNLAQYKSPEQRKARHILITVAKTAKADEVQKAKVKAEALLAKVRANPAEFAAVAKADSQDPGSAATGGDLGFFARGAMVKPFEDAAFSMKKEEISNLVQSDFGFHIIQVTDIKPEVVKPFAEVRPEIEKAIRQQQATKLFADAAESFSNMVYDQSDSLKPVIDKFKLTPVAVKGVQRTPLPGAAPGSPLASPEFLAALFSDDVIRDKHNTKAVTVGTALVSGRMVSYQPAQTKPLEQVSAAIKEALVKEESAKLARKEADQLLERARKGEAVAGFAAPVKASRLQPNGLSAVEVESIFKLGTKTLPAYTVVDLGAKGVAIAKVSAVEPAPAELSDEAKKLKEANLNAWKQGLARSAANAAQEALKLKAKVEIKKTFESTAKG